LIGEADRPRARDLDRRFGSQTSSGSGGSPRNPRDATLPAGRMHAARPDRCGADAPPEADAALVLDASRADSADGAPAADAAGRARSRTRAGRASDKGRIAIVAEDGQIDCSRRLALGGDQRCVAVANGNVAFAYKRGAREMTAASNSMGLSAPAGSEVPCASTFDGNYLIGEAHDGGVGYLREVNATGKVVSTIS